MVLADVLPEAKGLAERHDYCDLYGFCYPSHKLHSMYLTSYVCFVYQRFSTMFPALMFVFCVQFFLDIVAVVYSSDGFSGEGEVVEDKEREPEVEEEMGTVAVVQEEEAEVEEDTVFVVPMFLFFYFLLLPYSYLRVWSRFVFHFLQNVSLLFLQF